VKDPSLRLQTRFLQWLIAQEKLSSDRTLHIDHYQKQEQPTTQPPKLVQQIEADQVDYDLKTKVAVLKKNVQMNSIEPPAQAVSDNITWNVDEETVLSPETIKIVQIKDQLTVTGNQGLVNLKTKIANLIGGVQASSGKNQSTVFANQMEWNLDTQDLQANGNVIYQQANPILKVIGSEASGKLNSDNIVVTGTKNVGGQVVTEIIPEKQ
jgi:lipopolysaccharide export system protein LptA